MVEAIKDYFLQNWILLLLLGAFFVILFVTSYSNKRTKIKYVFLLISILLLSMVVFAEFYLQPVLENKTARLILMAIRYSATPFILALVIMVLVTHQKYFVFIPAGTLLVIDIVSIFTGIVFSINDDHKLVRGPLWLLPYIVCALYMVFLIFLLIKRSNKRRFEIAPIIFLAVALSTGVILPFVLGKEFAQIFCSIIAASLFIYYVFNILELVKKDALTGLLNRHAYFTETKSDYKDITAIISLDMNELKTLNDKHGHAAGDEALSTLSYCFARACKTRQSVYRMGGDEFVIVCRKTSKEDVEALVGRIKKYVSETKYTCSIGYSYHEEGTISLDDLLSESDARMYQDKSEYYKNK